MTTPASVPSPKNSPPPAGRVDAPAKLRAWLILLVQLAVALLVVREYDLEQRRDFFSVMCLATAGFAAHCWLPMKLRLPFFLALSVGSLFLLLSWQEAAQILAVGGTLIVICRLPIAFRLRIALLFLAVGNLAVWRRNSIVPFSFEGLPLPELPEVVWQVAGAMFMFRLIVYVHELRQGSPGSWLQTLAYFFMLPNACFPLFPIVDYATFRRTYYDGEDFTIYRTGMNWIGRGLIHLLLYRWIKLYVLPEPQAIDDGAHLALFLAANYALYMRVSGQFHLITGVLHLFGFNLPRTHHLYFLASSFTDIWRRINIYWKDFLQKTCFLPAFFRWRARGNAVAVVVATMWVFICTWLLHPFQVFWLQGEFPLTASDAILWLSLGALVTVNALWDFQRAKRGKTADNDWSWTRAAVRSLQTIGMFAAVSVFWGAWTHPVLIAAPGMREFPIVRGIAPWQGAAWAAGFVLAAVAAGAAAQWLWRKFDGATWHERFESNGAAVAQFAVLTAMLLLGRTESYSAQAPALAVRMNEFKSDLHSQFEAGQAAAGYYEQIADTSLPSDAFMGADRRALAGRNRHYSEMMRPNETGLKRELVPGWQGRFDGSLLTVNRWGMRERHLAKSKPPGTIRIAVVGSSVVMGYGVTDQEVFDELLEERLNRSQPPGEPRFEVLNFGSAQSYAIHRRLMLEQRVLEFQPDAVFYFSHQDELTDGPEIHLAYLSYHKFKLDSCLQGVLRETGVTNDTSWGMTQSLLTGHAEEIVDCTYRQFAGICREHGILPVWIYLPMPGIANAPLQFGETSEMARNAGFSVVDLSDWADGRRPEDMKLGPTDYHANAAGHKAFAARLFDELLKRPELAPGFKPVR